MADIQGSPPDRQPATKQSAGKKGAPVDAAKIATYGGIVVGAAKVVTEVWDALDHDDRISDRARALAKQVQQSRELRTPVARIRAQLDEVERYAAEADAGTGVHLARPGQAAGWRARASQIRAKLPLVETMGRRDKAKHLRGLSKATTLLLNEIVSAEGGHPGQAPAGSSAR